MLISSQHKFGHQLRSRCLPHQMKTVEVSNVPLTCHVYRIPRTLMSQPPNGTYNNENVRRSRR